MLPCAIPFRSTRSKSYTLSISAGSPIMGKLGNSGNSHSLNTFRLQFHLFELVLIKQLIPRMGNNREERID